MNKKQIEVVHVFDVEYETEEKLASLKRSFNKPRMTGVAGGGYFAKYANKTEIRNHGYPLDIGKTIDFTDTKAAGKSITFTRKEGVIKALRTVTQAFIKPTKGKGRWVDIEELVKGDNNA